MLGRPLSDEPLLVESLTHDVKEGSAALAPRRIKARQIRGDASLEPEVLNAIILSATE